MIAEKLAVVQENINKACKNAGRSPKEVTLISVSKTKPVEMVRIKCRRSWISMISSPLT